MSQRARTLRLTAIGDRAELEAFQVEIRRLARDHGLDVTSVDIAPIEDLRRPRPARRRALSGRRSARPPRG